MLHSVLLRTAGNLNRGLPVLGKAFPIRLLANGFTSIAMFDKVAGETLESLHESLDELMDQHTSIHDNELKDGVLTVTILHSVNQCIYVINKQSMNCQLWLSSPKSGPKRYDYFEEEDAWIYRRTMVSLHQLLQLELSDLLKVNVDLRNCHHSGKREA